MANNNPKSNLMKGSHVFIRLHTSDNSGSWEMFKYPVSFTIPSQAYETVDDPFLDQIDDITEGLKSTRSGGELTFTSRPKSTEDDAHSMCVAAVDVDDEFDFCLLHKDGRGWYVPRVLITDDGAQSGERDALLTNNFTGRCNAKRVPFETVEEIPGDDKPIAPNV